jgi:hypothetical protein
VLELILVFLLLVGGVSLFFADPLAQPAGPVAQILGSQLAAYFYASVFVIEGLWLSYAKVFKRKYSRKYALFIIYITLLFTILLEILLTGWGVAAVDNILGTIAAGWCWLNWKMRIEYLNPDEFHKEIEHLNNQGE